MNSLSNKMVSQNEDYYNRYNTFFNPNMCHVCKFKDHGIFKPCDQCYMITYCQLGHRQKDQPHHVQICTAMQKLLKSHPHFWVTVQLNLEEWIQSRKEFIRLIETELLRDLKSYEVQMIMFAKSCLICHQQVNIYPCRNCWSVNYCHEHANDFKSYHSSNSCKKLELCLNLDLGLQCGAVPIIKFSTFPDKTRPVVDMHSFVEQYVRRGYYSRKHYQWLSADYFYSDYVSAPLTLYFGLQDVDLLDPIVHKPGCYVVHIIAASPVDREYLTYWELLLHLVHGIKYLKIVLIGPELYTESDEMTLCAKCYINHRQHFNFECYNIAYYNYVDSDKYTQPNVIMICQADFNQWNVSESILKIRDQNCPLFLTAKSNLKLEQSVSKIEEVLNSSLSILYHGENKFSSGKPYRDYETDSASYRNKYLVIYQNLFKSFPS